MEKWSKKLRRSGYPATWRHEVIKAAYEKFDKMCEDEDNGVRPIHRPREWKERERRLEKEAKVTNWHKSRPDQVSAPLILDPTAGSLSKDIKGSCKCADNSASDGESWHCQRGPRQACKSNPLH